MRIRDDPIGQVFPLRHRGFDRVSADCRAGDRVGPKKNRRWSAIVHFFGKFSHIFSLDCVDSPFQT